MARTSEQKAGEILIAGAGPVGLAAAVFLRQKGFSVRIFDPNLQVNTQSRALAVNPRTLDLLEECGVTEQILQRGLVIRSAQLWRDEKPLARMNLRILPNKRPFMVALSQATTEHLLAQKLSELGCEVERGWKIASVERNDGAGVEIRVEDGAGQSQKWTGSYLIAADGAHSVTRQLLQIPFRGTTLEDDWYLADFYFDTSLSDDQAHVEFLNNDFNFYLRVVADRDGETKKPALWRIVSSSPDFLSHLHFGKRVGEPVWQSRFKISHRINQNLAKDQIFFMGDAAHVHSPMGARGMNLGIEDAWTFAELLSAGHQDRYEKIRLRADGSVVRRIELLSNVVLARTITTRILRSLLARGFRSRFMQGLIAKTMSGLDHKLET